MPRLAQLGPYPYMAERAQTRSQTSVILYSRCHKEHGRRGRIIQDKTCQLDKGYWLPYKCGQRVKSSGKYNIIIMMGMMMTTTKIFIIQLKIVFYRLIKTLKIIIIGNGILNQTDADVIIFIPQVSFSVSD